MMTFVVVRSLAVAASLLGGVAPACQAPARPPAAPAERRTQDGEARRVRMVDEQLRARDINSARVLAASCMRKPTDGMKVVSA